MVTHPRRTSRSDERGATLFVVVLAVTLLTGVGLYSLHSSTLVARASGNQREARQSAYLAELGTLTAISAASQSPESFLTEARNAAFPCRYNLGVNTTGIRPACFKFEDSKYAPPTGATLLAADSLGPYSDIEGEIHTEVTDVAPNRRPVPGYDKRFEFWVATLHTEAELRRAGSTGACVATMMPISGQHVTRAHVVMGPAALQ